MSARKEFMNILFIARLNLIWIRKLKLLYLGYSIVIPSMFAFIFYALTGGSSVNNIILGSIVFSIVQPALLSTAKNIIGDRQSRSIALFRSLPITPLAYSIGNSLASVFVSLPSLLLFVALGAISGVFAITGSSIVMLVLVILSSWVIYTGLGYVLSMAAPNLRQASLYADLLWIFLIFFSPTYYSLNSVPYLLRYAFHANPVTYVSYLVRYSLTGLGDTLLISISAITQLALMVIFLAVMLRGWHWYEK